MIYRLASCKILFERLLYNVCGDSLARFVVGRDCILPPVQPVTVKRVALHGLMDDRLERVSSFGDQLQQFSVRFSGGQQKRRLLLAADNEPAAFRCDMTNRFPFVGGTVHRQPRGTSHDSCSLKKNLVPICSESSSIHRSSHFFKNAF